MSWILLIVILAGAAVLWRIVVLVRRSQRANQRGDWDAMLIERLRAQGSDPFQPHEVDFFFGLPSEAACQALRGVLESEGFGIDWKPVPENSTHPFSLHARKSLRLSVPGMREMSHRFEALAADHGGRYDGWTAGIVRHGATAG